MTNCSSRAPRFCILFIITLMICHPALGHFKFLSAESETYEVELIQWERYGPAFNDVRFVLLVREKATKAERTVTVANITTGLTAAEILGDTLVLFGERRSRANTITLVDLDTTKSRDLILHYGSSLSPNHNYLVFRAFYPPYGMLENRSDVVMVYDLSKGPSENRLPGVGDSTAGRRVGLPVYPPENVDPPTYLVWVPEERQRHYVNRQAGFLWAKDAESLFFIDRTRGQQLLVRVDLEGGLKRPRITTRPIDAASALAVDHQDHETCFEGERKYLAVTGMDFDSDGRILLKLKRELWERKIYRLSRLSVAPPEPAYPIQELMEDPQ